MFTLYNNIQMFTFLCKNNKISAMSCSLFCLILKTRNTRTKVTKHFSCKHSNHQCRIKMRKLYMFMHLNAYMLTRTHLCMHADTPAQAFLIVCNINFTSHPFEHMHTYTHSFCSQNQAFTVVHTNWYTPGHICFYMWNIQARSYITRLCIIIISCCR